MSESEGVVDSLSYVEGSEFERKDGVWFMGATLVLGHTATHLRYLWMDCTTVIVVSCVGVSTHRSSMVFK